jgi:hypothetical protein
MVAFVTVFMLLFGVWFVVAAIRPHPSSEAASVGVFGQLMGIGTGVWLIAVAVAAFAQNLDALLLIFAVSSVLYIVVAAVLMVGALAPASDELGGAHRREPRLQPEEPPRRRPRFIDDR